jgi:hypothetical protein
MGEYFEFRRETVEKKYSFPKKQRILLVLDVYSSYRNGEIIKLADAHTSIFFSFHL